MGERQVGGIPAVAVVVLAVGGLVSAGTGHSDAIVAGLLMLGGTRGLPAMVGWIVGGAVGGAALAAVGRAALLPSLDPIAAIGLGVALGGGVGAVANFVVTGDEADAIDEESVTVSMESDDAPDPRPADLFASHPDPIVYVGDEGHGPVVRAVNDAFEATFDVPGTAVTDAPLSEALFVADGNDATETGDERTRRAASIVEVVRSGEELDRVVTCETADGSREFRLRSTGFDGDGYVLFTPA